MRDKLKRCTFCDEESESIGTGLNEYGEECKYLIINTSSGNEEYLEIKYCPMCGRRLEVERNG